MGKKGYYFEKGQLYLTNYSLANKVHAYKAARSSYFHNSTTYYTSIHTHITSITITNNSNNNNNNSNNNSNSNSNSRIG